MPRRQSTRQILEEIRDLRLDMREMRIDMRETRDEVRAALRRNDVVIDEAVRTMTELREDTRAHTRAILALIDRLEGGGPLPST